MNWQINNDNCYDEKAFLTSILDTFALLLLFTCMTTEERWRQKMRSIQTFSARFQDGGLFWTILLNLFLLLEKLEVAAVVWYLYAREQQWDQHEFMNKFCFCQSQKSKCSHYLLVELGLSICLQITWQITEKLTFWLVATIVLLLPEVKLETIQFTWYGFSFSCSFSGCRL